MFYITVLQLVPFMFGLNYR